MGMRDIDRQIAEAVQAERQRIYELFLTTPWPDDMAEWADDDSPETQAVKVDRFNLMRLVRDGAKA